MLARSVSYIEIEKELLLIYDSHACVRYDFECGMSCTNKLFQLEWVQSDHWVTGLLLDRADQLYILRFLKMLYLIH